jgi:hypothetical protein
MCCPANCQVFGAVCIFYAMDQLEKVTGLGEQTE